MANRVDAFQASRIGHESGKTEELTLDATDFVCFTDVFDCLIFTSIFQKQKTTFLQQPPHRLYSDADQLGIWSEFFLLCYGLEEWYRRRIRARLQLKWLIVLPRGDYIEGDKRPSMKQSVGLSIN